MPKSKEPGLVFLDALRGLAALVVFLGHAKFFLVPITLGEAIAGGAILTIIAATIMQFFVMVTKQLSYLFFYRVFGLHTRK